MLHESHQSDANIIHTAYADRVKESFKVFAENLSMGENERSSRERFVRSVEQARRARDVALEAIAGSAAVTEAEAAVAESAGPSAAPADDGLSDEERAMIEQALSGTTGQRAPEPLPGANARSPLMRR